MMSKYTGITTNYTSSILRIYELYESIYEFNKYSIFTSSILYIYWTVLCNIIVLNSVIV